MRKHVDTFVYAIIVGIVFVVFIHTNLWQKIPGFRCEGFGCIGAFILFAGIVIGVLPVLFGIFGFIRTKENRLKHACIAWGIALLIMLLAVGVATVWKEIESREASARAKELNKQLDLTSLTVSQELEHLPLLDNRRFITIVNQLTNSTMITQSPFAVQAYAREDAMLSDSTLQAQIMVFVPGSIERKIIATGKLLPTQDRSADGRLVFEGLLAFTEQYGATSGYLSVKGKDGASTTIAVSFK